MVFLKETKHPIFSIPLPKDGNYDSLKRMAQEYGKLCEEFEELGEIRVGIWSIKDV